jgi:acyl-CoA dehydrogenase
MDFAMPEEVKMVRESVRRFVEEHLLPPERQFLLDGRLGGEERRRLQLKLRDELGLWALGVPEKYGGNPVSTLAQSVVTEELNRSCLMLSPGGFVPEAIIEGATPFIEENFIVPTVEGTKVAAEAGGFTEPGAGSDLQRIETKAVRDGDDWIINGEKVFISGGDTCDYLHVLTVTDKEKRAKGGMTMFIVERGMPGFKVLRTIPTMGDDWEPAHLVFDDVRVPATHVLGEVGWGFYLGSSQLAIGRLHIAAINCGMAGRCLEMALEWAKQRVQFGEPIAERQAIQWMLADSALELYAGRLRVYHVSWLADQKLPIRNEAFYAKLYCTEMAHRVTDRALQIFGGYGYTRDLPIQSFYRQNLVWRIGHGTSELHRWMIARNLLKSGLDPHLFE